MKKQIPPEWKYVRNIMDLVYLAEVDFLVCDIIYKKTLDTQLIGYDFFILSANNSFYESIEILYTLIYSTKKEELRIEPVLKEIIEKGKGSIPKIEDRRVNAFLKFLETNYPSPDYHKFDFGTNNTTHLAGDVMVDIRKRKRILSGLNDLKVLKKQFENFNFHKIRHQAAAHKNKLLQSPAGAANLLIKKDLIEKLGKIIKVLKINCNIWFDYQLGNPYNFILQSLDKLF